MDFRFYLAIICTICWITTGILRIGIYINIGGLSNIIIAVMSFICAVLWSLTAYWSLI